MRVSRTVIYLFLAILPILVGVITNYATSYIPDKLKPYIWLSWPILGFLLLLIIVFSLIEAHQKKTTSSLSDKSLHLDDKDFDDLEVLHRPSSPIFLSGNTVSSNVHIEDWSKIISYSIFYDRQKELSKLKRWIQFDICRLIGVFGIGGIGKTALVAKLIDEIYDQFEYVVWRSLLNAPPIEETIIECIQLISNQQVNALPPNLDRKMIQLIEYLQDHRCLLVFDNAEAIMDDKKQAGSYRQGYESYGKLLKLTGESLHQSCIIVTSRQKPKEFILLEGKKSPIRSLKIDGLALEAGRKILGEQNLIGINEKSAELVERYAGNPLALKLVSATIKTLFGGDITFFLKRKILLIGEIFKIIDEQFDSLTDIEQEIMYWLAIEREMVGIDDLKDNIPWPIPERELLEALESLQRRSMIESREAAYFTLQPMVMEYTSDRMVKKTVNEIIAENGNLFISHALMKGQSKDYIRSIQNRIILDPVSKMLLEKFNSQYICNKLFKILSTLRDKHFLKKGYAGGNTLNILFNIGYDTKSLDFSELTVWQAYLQDKNLKNVNFANSDLSRSVFTDRFGSILAVAFSPNGNLLAAGSSHCDVRVWRTIDGKHIRTYEGHKDWIKDIAFSPDGKILASSSGDETIRIWDISTPQNLKVFRGHTNQIRSIAFSPDGKILASASDDCSIRLWEVETGKCNLVLQEGYQWILSVVFHPNGKIIASGGDDKKIRFWDLRTGECLRVLEGHQGSILSIAFMSNGNFIASAGEDKLIRLWNFETGQYIKSFKGHEEIVRKVVFSMDGHKLASGGDDRTIRIWDVNSGKCVNVLRGHLDQIRDIVLNSDNKTLASGSKDKTLRLWNIDTNKPIQTLQGYIYPIWSVACSADGKMFASSSSDQATLLVWSASTYTLLNSLTGHITGVRAICFSPDSKSLISAGLDMTVRVWDVNTGECFTIFHKHNARVLSLAISPNGNIVASAGSDKIIRLWNIISGQQIKNLNGHTAPIWAIAFSHDGQLIASAGDDETVRLWDVNTSSEIRVMHGHTNPVLSVVFSLDDSLLITCASDKKIKVWDVNTGKNIKTLEGHREPVWSVALSPNGKELASSSADHTIRLWDISTGENTKLLEGHTGIVRSVAFSSNDYSLISGSDDETIKIWDLKEGQCTMTLRAERIYERMDISGAIGLTKAQRETLKELGAIEN